MSMQDATPLIVAALIAGGFALAGSWLTHWYAGRRGERQREHELRTRFHGQRLDAYSRFMRLVPDLDEALIDQDWDRVKKLRARFGRTLAEIRLIASDEATREAAEAVYDTALTLVKGTLQELPDDKIEALILDCSVEEVLFEEVAADELGFGIEGDDE